MSFNIYVDNDNLVWLRNLRDEVTGDFDSGAAASLLINTASDTLVGSAAMTFKPGSTTGEYYGGVDDAVALLEGQIYTAVVTAVGSAGQKGVWTEIFTAQRRN